MAKQRQRLIEVPFSKTECGVDFFINTAHGRERPGVLTEYEAFKTDFFEIFFIRKANGYVLIDLLVNKSSFFISANSRCFSKFIADIPYCAITLWFRVIRLILSSEA